MKVQRVGVVVVPVAVKFSFKVVPGAMDFWNQGGSRYMVSPWVWNLAGHAASMLSLGSTAAISQPLIALLPLLTMVNWPWKPFPNW